MSVSLWRKKHLCMAKLNREEYLRYMQQGLNTASPQAKAMIIGTCQDINDRIERNLKRLAVSPYRPVRFSGNLARSIHWAAWQGSGGDIELCTFYVIEYIRFVEYAVQRHYKLSNGGKPSPISSVDYARIAVDRRLGSRRLKRKAAPFFFGELLLHSRMLSERLTAYFGYVMGINILYDSIGVGPSYEEHVMRLTTAGFEMK